MAEVEVKYTIPPQGSILNSSLIDGSQVDVTFTFNPTQNPDGSYTVTGATGTYQTTQRVGDTVSPVNTDTITGIGQAGIPTASAGSDDNEIFLVSDPGSMPIVTGGGIDFTISSTTDATGGVVNFYDIKGKAAGTTPTDVPTYMENNTGNDSPATNVTETVISSPCFTTGTLIRTLRGDVAVEQIDVGDFAITTPGTPRRIRWLGHRTIDCRSHPRRQEILPVCIAAHAFGDSRPARALCVSPGHAICVDVLGEVLIPAGALVNGSTIQQVEVDEVTYWHVELDSHDIIIAENLPAESYLDMGNRGFFKEADVVDLAAGPDVDALQRTHADFCRPYVDGGPILDAVRAQLAKRAEAAGWSLTNDIDLHLEVDGVRIDPVVRDLVARFHVPAAAKDVWLVSPTARPCDTMGSPDARNLGLTVTGLRIEDGLLAPCDVAMSDPLLCIGFHDLEDGCRRWTAGRARLPAALWKGCDTDFYLRVDFAGDPILRWIAPVIEERLCLAIMA